MPAAVRMPRSAAGRRALLTVAFLGGLFALAFFFGGSAHAATAPDLGDRAGVREPSGPALGDRSEAVRQDTAQGGESAVRERTDSQARQAAEARDRLAGHRERTRAAAGEVTTEVTRPVRDGAERTRQATRPVDRTVQQVTQRTGLDEATGGLFPDRLTEHDRGSGTGADRATAHQDGPSRDSADRSAHRDHAKGSQAASQCAPHTLSDGAAHQQASAGGGFTGDDSGHGLPGPRLPHHQLPSAPAVSAASQTVGDGSGKRGGPDQLAAYVTDMERAGPLLPGAVRAEQDGPTRERAGNILEFPG